MNFWTRQWKSSVCESLSAESSQSYANLFELRFLKYVRTELKVAKIQFSWKEQEYLKHTVCTLP